MKRKLKPNKECRQDSAYLRRGIREIALDCQKVADTAIVGKAERRTWLGIAARLARLAVA